MECREDYRYNVEAVEVLIRSHLVHVQQYDLHLAAAMENGLNYTAAAFAMQLLQRFCMDDKQAQDVMVSDGQGAGLCLKAAAWLLLRYAERQSHERCPDNVSPMCIGVLKGRYGTL